MCMCMYMKARKRGKEDTVHFQIRLSGSSQSQADQEASGECCVNFPRGWLTLV